MSNTKNILLTLLKTSFLVSTASPVFAQDYNPMYTPDFMMQQNAQWGIELGLERQANENKTKAFNPSTSQFTPKNFDRRTNLNPQNSKKKAASRAELEQQIEQLFQEYLDNN
jgi:hypothetical protein